jgi:hypothetical protein
LEKDYQYKSEGITLVKKNVKDCEKILLSVCNGMFPKSIGVSKDSKR